MGTIKRQKVISAIFRLSVLGWLSSAVFWVIWQVAFWNDPISALAVVRAAESQPTASSPDTIDGHAVVGQQNPVPPAPVTELSLLRQAVQFVRDCGVPGLLIVIIWFLWSERKEKFKKIDLRFHNLEIALGTVDGNVAGIKSSVGKTESKLRKDHSILRKELIAVVDELAQSNRNSQWAFQRDHEVIMVLLPMAGVTQSQIEEINKRVDNAMIKYSPTKPLHGIGEDDDWNGEDDDPSM